MDDSGLIYDADAERQQLAITDRLDAAAERKLAEDQARLDGYLRGRAESDAHRRVAPEDRRLPR